MAGHRMRTVAVTVNVALLGLTLFAVSRPGVDLEGTGALLFVLMIAAPILSLVAMYWPTHLPSNAPSTDAATERHG